MKEGIDKRKREGSPIKPQQTPKPKELSDSSEGKTKEQKRAIDRLNDEIGYFTPSMIPRKSVADMLLHGPLFSSKFSLKIPLALDDSIDSELPKLAKEKFRTTSFHLNDRSSEQMLLTPQHDPRDLAKKHDKHHLLDNSPKSATKSKFFVDHQKRSHISSFLKQ